MRDAKVISASVQTDRLGVLQQMGVVPLDVGRRPEPAPDAAE
ncbi:hypothetical protein [Sorangium cellulosum]|nr:hypothetical protein [Sorangium cellulosum]